MKLLTRAAIAAAAFLAFSTPSLAVVYECNVTKSNADYIPTIVIIDYNTNSGAVTVLDPVIKHFLGRATNGEVVTENNKRITFKWSINGTKAGAQQNVNLRYRATVLKGSNKLTISGKPLGYTNNFQGSGKCKLK